MFLRGQLVLGHSSSYFFRVKSASQSIVKSSMPTCFLCIANPTSLPSLRAERRAQGLHLSSNVRSFSHLLQAQVVTLGHI